MKANKKDNYLIRPMQAADLSAVLLIEQEELFPWTEGMLRDCLQYNYECKVLILAEEIIGYAVLAVHEDQAELLNIIVKRNYQGQGFGEKLLSYIFEIAKNKQVKKIFLEVRVTNLTALSLYQKLNFQRISVRKDYYPSTTGREDALVLVCHLLNS